ncbi:MAG: hypothetical protein V1773_15460 [bacterium]
MEKETEAKVAAGVAGTATVGGAVGTVAAAGTAGLSTAGMTTGLAAIGSVVGGGMAAGIIITAAAPLAVAAITYGVWRWVRK